MKKFERYIKTIMRRPFKLNILLVGLAAMLILGPGCSNSGNIQFVLEITDTEESKNKDTILGRKDTDTTNSGKSDGDADTDTDTDIDADTDMDTDTDTDTDADTDTNSDTEIDTSEDTFTSSDSEMDELPADPCNVRGVYGAVYTFDVYWGGRTGGLLELVQPGRGIITFHALTTIDTLDDKGNFKGTARACSTILPTFFGTDTLCEAYLPYYKNEVWDSPGIPVHPLEGTVTCTKNGCTLHIDTNYYLLGLSMKDKKGKYPAPNELGSLECNEGTGIDCFPDHDKDGNPGVTVRVRVGGTVAHPGRFCGGTYDYKASPLSSNLAQLFEDSWTARTDRIHIGQRMILESDLTSDHNGNFRGTAIGEGFQPRSLSCMVQQGTRTLPYSPAGPNQSCNDGQAAFVNRNMPLYVPLNEGEVPPERLNLTNNSPSKGGHVSFVKLDGLDRRITCEDVRKANY